MKDMEITFPEMKETYENVFENQKRQKDYAQSERKRPNSKDSYNLSF